MTDTAQPTIEVDDAPGHPPVIWLDNGILRLGILPAAGGRVLSVQLHGHETIWRDPSLLDDRLHPVGGHTIQPHDGPMSEWTNYGGDKTWPAPQGWSTASEWHGPPDPVLDSGAYAWETEDSDAGSTVTLTSSHDGRTGLTITRRIHLAAGSSAYGLVVSARNSSTDPVRWAVWNVMQRAASDAGAGGVWAGIGPGPEPAVVPLIAGTAHLEWERCAPDILHIPHQDVVGKVGLPSSAGWIAHAADDVSTALSFPVHDDEEYPDAGSRAEVWMEHPIEAPLGHLGGLAPRHRIVEIEALSPLTALAPDESVTLEIQCGLSTGSGDVSGVSDAGHWGDTRVENGAAAATFYPYWSGSLCSRADGGILGEVNAGQRVVIRVDASVAGTPVILETAFDARVDAGNIPEPIHSRRAEEVRQ